MRDDDVPTMRCYPQLFMLSHTEDSTAHKILLDMLFAHRATAGEPYTDGYLDCHCFHTTLRIKNFDFVLSLFGQISACPSQLSCERSPPRAARPKGSNQPAI